MLKVHILLCKDSIKMSQNINLHNFITAGIIINYYNSPRTVSVKVVTFPVASE